MHAEDVLSQLQSNGLTATVTDGRLTVRPRSAITDDLRALIQGHRDDLLALVQERRLQQILELGTAGLPLMAGDVRQALSPDDLDDLRSGRIGLAQIRAFAQLRSDRLDMDAGRVPTRYTATTECAGCGPVPIWEGAPSKVHGCPWCRVRLATGNLPRAAACADESRLSTRRAEA